MNEMELRYVLQCDGHQVETGRLGRGEGEGICEETEREGKAGGSWLGTCGHDNEL